MKNYIQGIDHVQVAAPVGCEEEARDFYGNTIGMKEIPKPEELKNEVDVGLNAEIKKSILVSSGTLHQLKGSSSFYVNEINEFKQTLIEQGVKVIDDYARPDVIRFYVSDPFGNRIEFMQNKD